MLGEYPGTEHVPPNYELSPIVPLELGPLAFGN